MGWCDGVSNRGDRRLDEAQASRRAREADLAQQRTFQRLGRDFRRPFDVLLGNLLESCRRPEDWEGLERRSLYDDAGPALFFLTDAFSSVCEGGRLTTRTVQDELVRALSSVNEDEGRAAIRELADVYVDRAFPGLSDADRTATAAQVDRVLQDRVPEALARAIRNRTVDTALRDMGRYADALATVTRDDARRAVDMMAGSPVQGLSASLQALGLEPDRANPWAERAARGLAENDRSRLADLIVSSASQLASELRGIDARDIAPSHDYVEATRREFGPALRRSAGELGYHIRTASGDETYAHAAFDSVARADRTGNAREANLRYYSCLAVTAALGPLAPGALGLAVSLMSNGCRLGLTLTESYQRESRFRAAELSGNGTPGLAAQEAGVRRAAAVEAGSSVVVSCASTMISAQLRAPMEPWEDATAREGLETLALAGAGSVLRAGNHHGVQLVMNAVQESPTTEDPAVRRAVDQVRAGGREANDGMTVDPSLGRSPFIDELFDDTDAR